MRYSDPSGEIIAVHIECVICSPSSASSRLKKLAISFVAAAGSVANPFASANEQVGTLQRSSVSLLSSNPIKENIKLRIELERAQKIVVAIMDVEGRTLFTKTSSYAQGRHEAIFTTGLLPTGSYFLKITGETFMETKKLFR